ncbi:uncharacterized protein G2W53_038575 [Senna tora]|uniref:Uncharacterized protein n=1 Tax=Senna tora TaxID=362788 RepID=A0A834SZN1_9FABA|nr:uncharacterized protein G2W53_038575 [Senna tora]
MDLQLGLALPNNPNKRSFSQLFQHSSRDVLLPTTLPLLPLTPSSHQHHDHHTTSSIITTKNFTECAQRLKLLKNSGRLQWQQ